MTSNNIAMEKDPIQMLFERAAKHPNKIYMRQPINGEWTEFTWAEVADQVCRMATALKGMGIGKGDTVAIGGRNTAHWIMADLAALMAGASGVGLYPKMSTDHMKFVIEHSGAKALFAGPADDSAAIDATVPRSIPRIALPYPTVEIPCDHQWADLIAANEPMTEADYQPATDNDMGGMIYTSGTTGNPKGVMITVGNLKFAMGGLLEVMGGGESERWFSYLPLAHIFERGVTEFASLYQGAEISFLENLEMMQKQLKEVAPTRFVAVPLVWTRFQRGIMEKMPPKKMARLLKIPFLNNVIRKKVLEGIGLQNARLCISGAAPLAPSTIEWFQALGINICQGYGMSENSAYCTFSRPENNRIGAVGQAVPGCELKIDDSGEILVKHPAVFAGYYKDEAKTAETMTEDGYLKTGDRGRIDEDGFLWITGRVKDIFKTEKGKYIAPVPIENKLAKNEYVEELCLIGSGQKQPVLIVTLSEGAKSADRAAVTASLEAETNEANKTLENHERIAKTVIDTTAWTVENGRMTPTMKVRRHDVEESFTDNIAGWYSESDLVLWHEAS